MNGRSSPTTLPYRHFMILKRNWQLEREDNEISTRVSDFEKSRNSTDSNIISTMKPGLPTDFEVPTHDGKFFINNKYM